MTDSNNVLNNWEKQKQRWNDMNLRIQKTLNEKEYNEQSKKSMQRATLMDMQSMYRARIEERGLLPGSIPLEIMNQDTHWADTLRTYPFKKGKQKTLENIQEMLTSVEYKRDKYGSEYPYQLYYLSKNDNEHHLNGTTLTHVITNPELNQHHPNHLNKHSPYRVAQVSKYKRYIYKTFNHFLNSGSDENVFVQGTGYSRTAQEQGCKNLDPCIVDMLCKDTQHVDNEVLSDNYLNCMDKSELYTYTDNNPRAPVYFYKMDKSSWDNINNSSTVLRHLEMPGDKEMTNELCIPCSNAPSQQLGIFLSKHCLEFISTPHKAVSSVITIKNTGNTALIYTWDRCAPTHLAGNAQSLSLSTREATSGDVNNVNLLNSNFHSFTLAKYHQHGVLRPGESVNFVFCFKSSIPGTFSAQFAFRTNPPVNVWDTHFANDKTKETKTYSSQYLKGKSVINMQAHSISETNSMRSTLGKYLKSKETYAICRDIIISDVLDHYNVFTNINLAMVIKADVVNPVKKEEEAIQQVLTQTSDFIRANRHTLHVLSSNYNTSVDHSDQSLNADYSFLFYYFNLLHHQVQLNANPQLIASVEVGHVDACNPYLIRLSQCGKLGQNATYSAQGHYPHPTGPQQGGLSTVFCFTIEANSQRTRIQ